MKKKNKWEQIENSIKNPTGIQMFILEKPQAEPKKVRPQFEEKDLKKCAPIEGGYMSDPTLIKCTMTMQTTKEDGTHGDIISLKHPTKGEIQFRIYDDGTVECLADSKFGCDSANGIGRFIKVEYFCDPY